ncbi:MAG TPA: bifunctional (p)ppGpp synthetase/guanosine-3',5'-bis(diphosphate) 3'-pyrophosphohydrolase [Gemmatimonadaceae bacterium]|nr:bifunctional (p)ppGpp synthetase/guanosine-3',5'-bis(diphosphate) 3'-pyrophosphohydrolase [Gemmatimonadaceae bacterium]
MTAVPVREKESEKDTLPEWLKTGLPDRLDRDLLTRAYRFSEKAHEGQKRLSGERFVSHCVEVAKILVDLQLDSTTVASGLIHDVVEDTNVTVDDIEAEFGKEIAEIVDGLTKIGHLPLNSSQERQVENYRKLLLSIAKDARVILIKLADRLHNMRTLEFLPADRQKRIATETRDLYAPLAHRFGMARVRWELEDLAFKHLEPAEYKTLAKKVATRRTEREKAIAQLKEPLENHLRKAGVVDVEVTGRPKHLWSIYKKMKKWDKPYEEIYDLLAVRVLVNTVPDCYHALGVIHDQFTPLQERIKDYIAQPKSNGYQSLHTTVFGPGSQLFEIQIRTREMHRTAEYGIAAHWRFKEDSGKSADELDRALQWFRQVLELQLDAKTPDEFLEFLKLDLYQDEIFVFTPTGDVIQLPKGATPIDFAFAVHTEVGLHCQGARINGRIASLARELKNSETVEIITSPSAKPSRDWLAHVRTGRARHKIRQRLRIEEHTTSIKLGREILDREIKRRRLAKPEDVQLLKVARTLHLNDVNHLIASIGQGDVNVSQVLKELYPETDGAPEAPKPGPLDWLVDKVRGTTKGVRIQGVDGMMVRYAQCCQPVPGDPVVGYVTRGRGVSIHRSDCPNLLMLIQEPERRLEIDWKELEGEKFMVRLALEATDRRGLYADLATAVSATGTDIRSFELHSSDGHVVGELAVEVGNLAHLQKILKAARRVKGVTEVSRRERLSSDIKNGQSGI